MEGISPLYSAIEAHQGTRGSHEPWNYSRNCGLAIPSFPSSNEEGWPEGPGWSVRLPLPRFRVLFILIPQVLQAYMRVLLCRGQAGMAQKFLDTSQVGPSFQEMRRKTVTQGMRRDPAGSGKIQPETFDQSLNIAGT